MSELALHREQVQAIALPAPRHGAIHIRLAVPESNDIRLIDALQKKFSRNLGFAPLGQLTKNIADGHVLIAEQDRRFVGYCVSRDRYDRNDSVGIVYQLAVVEGKQRGLIGATLIKEVFNRAAYGCKLFCCWCAQDLEANYFWESLGFVPLAFRTGSRKVRYKDGTQGPRIHIFWQRRIREGDEGAAAGGTPYWFPKETGGGAVKENRLVLPIPPGTSWQDAKPAILPGMENVNVLPPGAKDESARKPKEKKVKAPPRKVSHGLWFAPPIPPTLKPGSPEAKAAAKAEKPKREKFKNDPKMVEAARELRDRYIEQINAGLLLPPSANGKYDVSRQLEAARSAMKVEPARLLEAA